MRVLFAGSPEIAVPSLNLLLASEHQLCGVLTNPDRERGRGRKVAFTAVKVALIASGKKIPLFQFPSLDAEAREIVAAVDADILAVYAYGRIFGPKFLSLFPYGGINVHPSLLPKYRGAAPIPWTILSGDQETGISVQQLSLEMDRGDILGRTFLTLQGDETTESLSHWAAREGAKLLVETLDRIEAGTVTPEPQREEEASWSGKISREDGLIDWKLPAAEIDRRIRAYFPWPRAYTHLDGNELYILEAEPLNENLPVENVQQADTGAGIVAGVDRKRGILVQTGDGLLAVARLQAKSRKAMDVTSFCNGYGPITGKALGGE